MRWRSKRSHGKIVEGWCSWHHRCKLWYFLFYILSCLWWLWALRGSMFPRRLGGAGPTTAVMPAISSIACSGFGSRMSWFPQVILAIRFACTHHRCRIIQWTNTHTRVCVCVWVTLCSKELFMLFLNFFMVNFYKQGTGAPWLVSCQRRH